MQESEMKTRIRELTEKVLRKRKELLERPSSSKDRPMLEGLIEEIHQRSLLLTSVKQENPELYERLAQEVLIG
ncbi:hypothetical protein IT398_02475 [Candidatus Nomurabacteria bacterium]|nr:hypothetical protein [Candidatus Nomurabacteria bacterium]